MKGWRRNERARILGKLLGRLHQRFGEETVDAGWSDGELQTISTGSLALDRALGCGGLPRGRVVEIFGEDASGKTALALLAVASCQAAGGVAAFIDAEHALDPTQVRRMGADPKALFVAQPEEGEQALEIADAFARSGAVDLVIVDSVAALVPRAELQQTIGTAPGGLQAQMMSQSLRRLLGVVARAGTVLVFVNQLRSRIDSMGSIIEGSPGGRALRYYASLRLEIRRRGVVEQGGCRVGSRSLVRVVKNRVAPALGEAELVFHDRWGFDPMGELLILARREGLWGREGEAAWAPGKRLGPGWDEARAELARTPALQERLRKLLLQPALPALGTGSVPGGR